MGIEGEDDGGESVVGRLLDKRTEHQLVTEMDAIKIADGNVSSASGSRSGESKVPVHGWGHSANRFRANQIRTRAKFFQIRGA